MSLRRPLSLFVLGALGAAIALACLTSPAEAQSARIRDLVMSDEAMPARLVGYGLVVGLDGTGDRGTAGQGSGQTVQSVASLLRRFDIEVPMEMLRLRNVAAVLVTAEVSPYLRPGGRFDVTVSSLGDARSLRGGTLWMTPLVLGPNQPAVAGAQGGIVLSDGGSDRSRRDGVETAGRVPGGGVLDEPLPRPEATASTRLLLREPDLATAARIATVIDSALGAGTARVEDPGAVALALRDTTAGGVMAVARVRELVVRRDLPARIVIDGRDGTVVAGGDVTIGDAVITHGTITLAIGGRAGPAPRDSAAAPGDVRIPAGATAQQLAGALHAVRTTPQEMAAIFSALREVGALAAEVIVR